MEIQRAIQEFEDHAYHNSLHPVISDEALTVALKALQEQQRRQGEPEIVQCGECKYHSFDSEYGKHWCNHSLSCREVKPDGYCNNGKR